jgi:hypothetical protein
MTNTPLQLFERPSVSVLPDTRVSGFLVVLVALLLVSSWLFFKHFIVATAIAGVCAAAVMRRWNARHPSVLPEARPGASRPRVPEINLSAIPVGGDAAGLLFASGAIAIVILGVPNMAWYFLGALGCSLLLACALFAARAAQAWQPLRRATLGLR